MNKTQPTDYDSQAELWNRDEPEHNSDFTGRPELMEMFREIGKGRVALNIGCGTGYLARQMAKTARKVIGIDKSRRSVEFAMEREKKDKLGILYLVGDAGCMDSVQSGSIDVCVSDYTANYFHPQQLGTFYGEISRVLDDKGDFLVLIPHPCLGLARPYGEVMHFNLEGYHYIRSRGRYFEATLRTRTGKTFMVGQYHSTLEDHFNGISQAGLAVTKILEPLFTPEITEKHPLFKELELEPVTMIMVGTKLTSSPSLPSST